MFMTTRLTLTSAAPTPQPLVSTPLALQCLLFFLWLCKYQPSVQSLMRLSSIESLKG